MTGTTPQTSVLFVCLGNICRSPAAEGVMQQLVNQRNLSKHIRVDSAGTAGYHIGKLADARMRAAAEKRGLDLTSRSRLVLPADLRCFDRVIAMDRSNYRDLVGLVHGGRYDHVRLLSDYLETDWPREVPDPYYGGDEGFDYVLDMLQAACPAILDELMSLSSSANCT